MSLVLEQSVGLSEVGRAKAVIIVEQDVESLGRRGQVNGSAGENACDTHLDTTGSD
jgi:hypothetical protein